MNPLLNLMGSFKQNDLAVMLFFIQGSKKIAKIIETVTKARTCRQTLEFVYMFLSCHVCFSEWIHTLQLPECQGTPCSKQAQYLKFI